MSSYESRVCFTKHWCITINLKINFILKWLKQSIHWSNSNSLILEKKLQQNGWNVNQLEIEKFKVSKREMVLIYYARILILKIIVSILCEEILANTK